MAKEAPAKPAAPKKRPERPFYWDIPNIAEEGDYSTKKRRPPEIALHNEDKCTGCQGCVPFCPVNCIESLPEGTYPDRPIQPVQDRWDECIGCGICVRICTKVVGWDAIRMVPVDEFMEVTGIEISQVTPERPPPVRSLPRADYPPYPE
ncbi:MAG TPA: 4Fe-4S binding protein [Chloroflexota bacterium]|nr:4Fe-4S binding protein [Chloroflexota bacterium]